MLRHRRKSSLGGRVDALNKLHDHFAASARLYSSGALEDQREAVFQTLNFTRLYLEKQGFTGLTLEPLMRAAIAIAELSSGKIDPVFAVKKTGRPAAAFANKIRNGIVAGFGQYWMDKFGTGDVKAKLGQAARKLRGNWFGSISTAQLRKYREAAMQEGKDHPTRLHSELTLKLLTDAEQRVGAKQAWEVMLEHQNREGAFISGGKSAKPKP